MITTQTPDPRPGFYYVSVVRGDRYVLLAGPYTDHHAGALADVERVRHLAQNVDPRTAFDAFGTCRCETDQGPGKLNHLDTLPAAAGLTA
jgi:hypothetical protein